MNGTDNMSFLNLHEVETIAKGVLPKAVYDYYRGGADSENTVRENLESFSRFNILPRILKDVSRVDLTSQLLGIDAAFPVLVAPMAMQGMAHADGEVATARAARKAGIPYVMSTMATSTQEEVASSGHPGLIFQLYVIRSREVVRGWVQRAQALGFRALMVTVDAQRLGKREEDVRNRFSLPAGLELKMLRPLREAQAAAAGRGDGGTAGQSGTAGSLVLDGRDVSEGSGLARLFAKELDDSLTWEFIPWLRTVTDLPIIVKGVLSPLDADMAVSCGVDAIVVSNHGGRQLDFSPTALDVLPAVLAAVHGRVPVLVDGGVRRGTDVLKALAMGASAVLLGRPVLYGLAVGGEAGVARVLDILREEFELGMALSGCSSLREINLSLLIPFAKL